MPSVDRVCLDLDEIHLPDVLHTNHCQTAGRKP